MIFFVLLGREDLSPGGGFSADSCGDGKKKKGPVPRQQEVFIIRCLCNDCFLMSLFMNY